MNAVLYGIAIVVFALDQWVKWLVRTHMVLGQGIGVWPPVLYLDYIRNPGGAFGILPNHRWLFVLVAVVVIAVVVWIERRWHPDWVGRIGLGLLLGGALGNLADRVIAGTVVDYVYFKIINFPVFNLADVSIDVGILVLILRSLKPAAREAEKES